MRKAYHQKECYRQLRYATYTLTATTLETFNSLYSFPVQFMILLVIMAQPAVIVFFTARGLWQQNHTYICFFDISFKHKHRHARCAGVIFLN